MLKFPQSRRPVDVVFKETGVALLESHHEEGFFMDWRCDPFEKILLVIGGEGILFRGEEQFALRAPSLLVVPAKARHRIADSAGSPLSLIGICLNNPTFPGDRLVRAACSEWRVEGDSPLTRQTQDWLREILVEDRLVKPGSVELQLSLVCRILVELARTGVQMNTGKVDSRQRVNNYALALERDFWRTDDLDRVSRALGLSRRRFTQLFRELTGESWLTRVTRLRLNHASELLRVTTLSVRSIAFECGYPDLSHFYRIYRARFGTTPGGFRDQLRVAGIPT
jgi:AraC family L-rhamnose operon regulatory protein RhaS